MGLLEKIKSSLRVKKRTASQEYLEILHRHATPHEGDEVRAIELAAEIGIDPLDIEVEAIVLVEDRRLAGIRANAQRAREERDNLNAKLDEALAERRRILEPIESQIRSLREEIDAMTARVAADADVDLIRSWIREHWQHLFSTEERSRREFKPTPPRQQTAITPAISAAIARRDEARRELAGEPEPGQRGPTQIDATNEAARRTGQGRHVVDDQTLYGLRPKERLGNITPMQQQPLGKNGRPVGEAKLSHRQPESIGADPPLPGEAADEAAEEAELPGK